VVWWSVLGVGAGLEVELGVAGGGWRVGGGRWVVVGSRVRLQAVRGRWAAWAVFAVTVVQLLVATLAPDPPQSGGKAFAAPLVAYPLFMLAVPARWWVEHR
jgi:hypothetical protein